MVVVTLIVVFVKKCDNVVVLLAMAKVIVAVEIVMLCWLWL